MALRERSKQRIISEYRVHAQDTGSPEVQVALLTKKISSLTSHLKGHRKDFDSRRGLLKMVGKRRRLLIHLKQEDSARYQALIKRLKLKDVVTKGGIFATHLEKEEQAKGQVNELEEETVQ